MNQLPFKTNLRILEDIFAIRHFVLSVVDILLKTTAESGAKTTSRFFWINRIYFQENPEFVDF